MLEADDCDDTVLVVMVMAMMVDDMDCGHWFILITILLVLTH